MNEWRGDSLLIRTQKALYKARAWVATEKDLVSQGRTLIVLGADRKPFQSVNYLLRQFGRVLLEGEREPLAVLATRFEGRGFSCDTSLTLLAGPANRILAEEERVSASTLSPGWTVQALTADSDPSEVALLQALQERVDITPLPGFFLRGIDVPAVTLTLRDENGVLVGGATALDLSSGRRSEAMVLGVCLDPAVQGRGYSYALNASTLKAGAESFGVRSLVAVVETGNYASFRMFQGCGLRPHPRRSYVFVKPPAFRVGSI